MDSQQVNDGFAVENADLGLVALRSPHLPVAEVLRELLAGLAQEGCEVRAGRSPSSRWTPSGARRLP